MTIIKGSLGSGKSILMNKISYEWAKYDNKDIDKKRDIISL